MANRQVCTFSRPMLSPSPQATDRPAVASNRVTLTSAAHEAVNRDSSRTSPARHPPTSHLRSWRCIPLAERGAVVAEQAGRRCARGAR
eukprot:scaffold306439_cov32-Tisochrysis_lutea.AAC.1